MRTFVIGDIHGAYKALRQCLERSGFDKQVDRLITLGDICDSWNEVYECVEELLTIPNRIDIKGNHDDWFFRFLNTGIHPDYWDQGGKGTADSYKRYIAIERKWLNAGDVPQTHWDFFARQCLYHIEGKRIFVHAGFDRFAHVKEQRHYNPRVFFWDRDLWKAAMSCKGGVKLQTVDDFDEIFIGHTSTTSWTMKEKTTAAGIIIPKGDPVTIPMQSGGVWNLDTGAGWYGKLTIMDVDTKEFWQSDKMDTLYDKTLGR